MRYSHEEPSRWGSCGKEVEIIDLTMSNSKAEEDDYFNNKDDDDGFSDDDGDEDDDDSNDEPNIDDFIWKRRWIPSTTKE